MFLCIHMKKAGKGMPAFWECAAAYECLSQGQQAVCDGEKRYFTVSETLFFS